ncbi:MAG TPA: toll/interleukin-1 receptor domain-containing protein [Verrucomicrobiae bacterium]|jgi:hypothetical protein|nr:toll/interleukin-1 receptor domain-containing protein [Verrucomicrobiae bacterium]
MAESDYPKPVAEVVATLADIYRHQGQIEFAQLLENSNAYFEAVNFDKWNGGTTTWALRLETPVSMYSSIEGRLAAIEREFCQKLLPFDRLHQNDPIGEVTISPITEGAIALGNRIAPSDAETRRLWPQDQFRLFISHVSAHKVAVSKLKAELAVFGIYGFVAHEAIQPTLEWQAEIELALRSMHALLALITPDFHASNWTDQEIGWAFGRGVLMLPVRLGSDPYGFAGKVQGISGNLEIPSNLAKRVVETLLANPRTHLEMRPALAAAFHKAESYVAAIALRNFIIKITDFTDAEKNLLRSACKENPNVANAYGVSAAIYKAFDESPKPAQAALADDDVPF